MTEAQEKTLLQKVATKLRELREARGLTGEQVAAQAKVGRRSLTRWEKGIQLPSGRNLDKLAKVYGVSASWITR